MNFDIDSYVMANLNKAKFTSTGEIVAECPWCYKYGAFYINRTTGNFVCFRCEERGRHLVGVVARVEGLSWAQARTYLLRNTIQFRRKETTETLLDKIRELRPDSEGEEEGEEKSAVDVPLPPEFIPVYNEETGAWKYPAYLKIRNIRKRTAQAWKLGYCLRGIYALRIIVPIECPGGRSFTARDTTGVLEPKIMNPKGANHRRLILGWNNIPEDGDIALVEGPFDAMKLWQHGIPAIAVLGKVLHSEQLSQLFARSTDSAIVVMLDPEEMLAPFEVAKQLVCRVPNVFIAKLPDGVDPGSSTKEQALEAYDKAEPYNGRAGRLSAILKGSQKKIMELYGGG